MKIIVSGGGTGGHIYPAITLIRNIQKKVPDLEVLYVGTKRGLESDIIPKEGFPFETVDIRGFQRRLTPRNLLIAGNAMLGVAKAAKIVRSFKPDVVVGTGGFVCGPVLMAASLMGVPTLIQEQNVIPGITNKILSKFVTKIAAGSREAAVHFPKDKVVFTGNPIRSEVMTANRTTGYDAFGLDPNKWTLLVSGGSRGAKSINTVMVDVIKSCAGNDRIQILHVTGKRDYDEVRTKLDAAGVKLDEAKNIVVKPYLYNMPQAMAVADLVLFRAGATGIAELTAKGIPAILVPYPYAAENHQEYNARELERAGAARVILNKDLSPEKIFSIITELFSEPEKLKRMGDASRALGRPDAADTIADMVIGLAENGK